MQRTRIMIAQDAQALGMTRDSLNEYDLTVVTDIQDAKYQVTENGIEVFVIGVHFDESRAIELVNFIRSSGSHKKTPILFVRLLPTTYRDILKTTILALVKAGTISQYLELEGDPNFAVRIKNAVSAVLSSPQKV